MALTTSIAYLLNSGSELLARQGVENPRMEAALLLAFAWGRPREYLYLEPEACLMPNQERIYRKALAQRSRRIPYAYIVGSREFMGLDYCVNEAVLIPRPETETLVEIVLAQKHLMGKGTGRRTWDVMNQGGSWPDKTHTMMPPQEGTKPGDEAVAKGLSLLDLCTGSGAVAIALAVNWQELTCVVGTDVSQGALEVACANARNLGVTVLWRQGDLWDALSEDESFDCITANPPYISDEEYALCAPEVHWEPRAALWGGTDGLDFYRRIAAEAANYLKPGGRMYLEIGWQQGKAVCDLLESRGFMTGVFCDLGGRERVVTAWKT